MLSSFNGQEVSRHSASCTIIPLTLPLSGDCATSHASITDSIWLFLPLDMPSSYSTYSRTFMLSVQFISFLKSIWKVCFLYLASHVLSLYFHSIPGFYFKVQPTFKFLKLKRFYFHSLLLILT